MRKLRSESWTNYPSHYLVHDVVTEMLAGHGLSEVSREGRYYAVRDNETKEVMAVIVNICPGIVAGFDLESEADDTHFRRCPESILSMLTPTDDAAALQWRADCRRYLDLKRLQPSVSVGEEIEFLEPIICSSGAVHSQMVFAGGFAFIPSAGVWHRLPKRWKTRYQWRVNGPISAETAIELADRAEHSGFRLWAARRADDPRLAALAQNTPDKSLAELLELLQNLDSLAKGHHK